MEIAPEISVLIPAYNEGANLGAAIGSVHRSFGALDQSAYEIIVCDNNSTDTTAAVARAANAQVVFEPHNQIARARNAAARAAKGRWLIFMDADTTLNPALLRETIDGFTHHRIGAGGAVVTLDDYTFPWHTRLLTWFWLAFWRQVSLRFKLAPGAYLYCLRDAWVETGGFDEQVYVSEEIGFSIKLKTWCRRNGLKFRIITRASVVTSSRKLKWYSQRQILRQMFVLARPSAMRQRRNCGVWYTRPSEP